MEHTMRIINITEAQNNLRELIDQVIDSSTATVITSDDRKSVVMMSCADYNGWTTTQHLMSSPENSSRLLQAIADVKAGEVIPRDMIDE
jgi:antitoxin YefM